MLRIISSRLPEQNKSREWIIDDSTPIASAQCVYVICDSLIWKQTTYLDILYHFALRVLHSAASLDGDRWRSETATVRRAPLHQKSVSEVGTFDYFPELIFNIYAPLRINIAILPVRRVCRRTLSLNIHSNYWTHHTFIFYETKMFQWERVQLFYSMKRLADRFDVKTTSSRPLNVSVFNLFK